MIEKIVIDYLNTVITDTRAYVEKPKNQGKKFILVEKTGGGEKNHIKTATVAIQSYADSRYNAAVLNEIVKDKMKNMISLPTVSKCKLNSDYPYPDTTVKEERYQAVFDIVFY